MDDWKQRVIDELEELEEKRNKLDSFVWDNEIGCYNESFKNLSDENKELLISQLGTMCDYIHILKRRIELF